MVREAQGISQKSRLTLSLLAFFLGWLGIHRFYTGKIVTGIVMLVLGIVGMATVWFVFGFIPLVIVGIWVLIDFIMAVSGIFMDSYGNIVRNWKKNIGEITD
jgi:TM2 domain-containing membrane protein YozV